jgi:hypothetical protein
MPLLESLSTGASMTTCSLPRTRFVPCLKVLYPWRKVPADRSLVYYASLAYRHLQREEAWETVAAAIKATSKLP